MTRGIAKRSIVVAGRKTSISLEAEFWAAAKEIARERDVPLNQIVTEIDRSRKEHNLSSAIRLFVLNYYAAKAKQP
jgi:predicted DNA-binding ribbon-helix-helix protein